MPERACPQCGEPLVPDQRQTAQSSVTVDACPVEDGVFLDEGEIEQLTLGRELHSLLVDELSEDVGAPRDECPSCNEIMVSERLELEEEDIELDVCTVCHGVWIRQDELSTLQAMAAQRPPMGGEEMDAIWDEGVPDLQRRETLGALIGTIPRADADEPGP